MCEAPERRELARKPDVAGQEEAREDRREPVDPAERPVAILGNRAPCREAVGDPAAPAPLAGVAVPVPHQKIEESDPHERLTVEPARRVHLRTVEHRVAADDPAVAAEAGTVSAP